MTAPASTLPRGAPVPAPASPRPLWKDVFVLDLGREKLLFSPLRDLCALLNGPALAALAGADEAPDPELAELRRLLRQPPPRPPRRRGPARPAFLGLVTTRGCNMACHYCDFAAATGRETMSLPLAMAAVEGWAARVRETGGACLELHFFGGEPFVAGDVIQAAVLRTRLLAARHGMATRFVASTNGLLSGRDLTFVCDYFDAIVLSLDGGPEEHDRHRPAIGGGSSFARVLATARRLSASPVDLCLRCCVSDRNVDALASIAEWMCHELQPAVIDFEPLSLACESEGHGFRPPAPLAFARGFVAASRIAARHGVACASAPLHDEARVENCPVGRDTFIVVPSGEVRSCYLRGSTIAARGLDLRIGQAAPGEDLAIDSAAVARLRRLAARRPGCESCFCRWSCAGGCVVREPEPRRDGARTLFCRQTRMLQACMLLERLGQPELTDRLLARPEILETLSGAGEDRLAPCAP